MEDGIFREPASPLILQPLRSLDECLVMAELSAQTCAGR